LPPPSGACAVSAARIQRSPCAGCRSPVIWATFADGFKRTVEECAEGEGDLALQCHLFKGAAGRLVEARTVLIRTSYRRHDCPGRPYRIGGAAELACLTCHQPMAALVARRSVCAACQAAEREGFDRLVGALVERFGAAAVLELLSRELRTR
jgi:hypothetical protein